MYRRNLDLEGWQEQTRRCKQLEARGKELEGHLETQNEWIAMAKRLFRKLSEREQLTDTDWDELETLLEEEASHEL